MSFPPVFNVPNAPGIPPMVRNVFTDISRVQGVIAGVQNTIAFFKGRSPLPTWGIFDDKFNSMVDADSIVGFNVRREASIPNYPKQGGQFFNYDKVVLPFTSGVRISKGGTLTDRANLLRQLETLFASLGKFTIVTPERSYLNVNLGTYAVTRMDKDQAFFLTDVELLFTEVQSVTALFTNTDTDTTKAQNPSAQPTDNRGVVQPADPSPNASAQAANAVAGGAP
jgi:hypothetical protein